jgi:hypothetical protein
MANPPVLYSANTWLAYQISKRYYGNVHWVWCSPHFDARSVLPRDATPPSSTPGDIYRELREATSRGDRHNAKIAANKTGLLNGVVRKREAEIITEQQAQELVSAIGAAEIIDFRPLMYVIPVTAEVAKLLTEAPIGARAHPLSLEYIIESLPGEFFDIIEPF